MKARIKPEWLTFWQDTCTKLNAPTPTLPASLDVGAIVTISEETIGRHIMIGRYLHRFVDIVGDDGRTASIDLAMLEVIE